MVGLLKQCLYKSVTKANLKWNQPVEILLEIENILNNRPLCYLEYDIKFPVVTSNTFESVNGDLRKGAKYIRRCKENAWKRWKNEDLKSLHKNHNMQSKKQELPPLSTGNVIIEGHERNRNHWTIGIVESLIVRRDGITRAAKVRTGESTLEIAIQQLYPLELRCDSKSQDQIEVIDDIKSIRKETPRNAAAIARIT